MATAHPALLAWGEFALIGAVIGLAGYYLSLYGDAIADHTGLARAWIGMVLVATVTSLPELVTGVTSVTVAAVPDIAVGDILGSCVFNLAIIVGVDLIHREESVYTRVSHGHILSAAFGVILIGLIGFSLLLSERHASPSLFHVGLYSPLIALIYLFGARTVFRFEQAQLPATQSSGGRGRPRTTLRQAYARYACAAIVVFAAGARLPYAAEHIAAAMGWNQSFVGTTFVALATSVPELAVTMSAVRVGAPDLALGNIFGSNLFNALLIAVDDVFYAPGPLLDDVSPVHALSAFSAAIMSGAAIVGTLYRPKTRVFKTVGWVSLALLALFLMNTGAIYMLQR